MMTFTQPAKRKMQMQRSSSSRNIDNERRKDFDPLSRRHPRTPSSPRQISAVKVGGGFHIQPTPAPLDAKEAQQYSKFADFEKPPARPVAPLPQTKMAPLDPHSTSSSRRPISRTNWLRLGDAQCKKFGEKVRELSSRAWRKSSSSLNWWK
jgi:hypothetical protein